MDAGERGVTRCRLLPACVGGLRRDPPWGDAVLVKKGLRVLVRLHQRGDTFEVNLGELLAASDVTLAEVAAAMSRHGADVPTVPVKQPSLRQSIRDAVRRRDGNVCRYCDRVGSDKADPDGRHWHIDHVRPVSMGGTDALDNLVVACERCNRAKGPRPLGLWTPPNQRQKTSA